MWRSAKPSIGLLRCNLIIWLAAWGLLAEGCALADCRASACFLPRCPAVVAQRWRAGVWFAPRPTNWDNYIRLSRDVHARLSNARLSSGLKLMLPPNSSSCLLYGFQTMWQMYKPIGTWRGSPSKQSHKQTLRHCSDNVISICLQPLKLGTDPATYPELGDQDVSDAAQNCHTVKNIPGIFEIILWARGGRKENRDGARREDRGRTKWRWGRGWCGGNMDGKGKEMSAVGRNICVWRATLKRRDGGRIEVTLKCFFFLKKERNKKQRRRENRCQTEREREEESEKKKDMSVSNRSREEIRWDKWTIGDGTLDGCQRTSRGQLVPHQNTTPAIKHHILYITGRRKPEPTRSPDRFS